MATIVTLKSVNDGLHTVEIKREFDSSTQTREFTKQGLNEYVEGLKQYCQQKGYEFIYNICLHDRIESVRTEKAIVYRCLDCNRIVGETEF